MDKRMITVGAISTLLGSGALYTYMERFEREATGGDLVQVAVLTQDVDPGDELSSSMVAATPVPERYVESRHIQFSDVDKALGMRLGLAGKAGETLLWTDLAGMQAEVRMLSQLVPEGMRAMPLSVRRGSLSQLLRPGDLVDILYTAKGQQSTSTKTLFQNVLVLAVGSDLGSSTGSRSTGSRGGEVTVSVTPEQGRVLAGRSRDGDLELALRNPDDVVHVQDSDTNAATPALAATAHRSETNVP